MTLKNSIYLAVITVGITFSSCTKTKVASPSELTKDLTTIQDYNYVGESHNKGMADFFEHYTPERIINEKTTIEDLNQFLIQTSNFKDKSFDEKLLSSDLFNSTRNVRLLNLSSIPQFAKLASKDFFIEVKKIDAIISKYNGNNINNYIAQIEELESSIILDSKLSESENRILLCALSTAKYSGRFWTDNYSKLIIKWNNSKKAAYKPSIEAPSYDEILVLDDIIKQDVAGAISGGVTGALIGGTVATPLGAAPGWLAGAVSGGVTGSITEFVLKQLDWLFPKSVKLPVTPDKSTPIKITKSSLPGPVPIGK